ncbi:MAG: cytochrome c [Pseudomonadota bacterium]
MRNIKTFTVMTLILLPFLAFQAKSELAASGEYLYLQNCMVCHGSDGSGAMPGVPDLTEQQSVFQQGDKQLVKQLKKGLQRPVSPMLMPPPQLSDKALLNTIRYMRQLIGSELPDNPIEDKTP